MLSGHLTSSKRRIFLAVGTVCACLLLSGCPTASNPTQSQSPPSSSPPSSSPGSSAGSSSSSGSSQGSSSSSGSQSQSSAGTRGGSSGEQSGNPGGAPGSPGGADSGSDSGEPAPGASDSVFGDAPAGESIPDLRDEPTLEDGPQGIAGLPGGPGEQAGSGATGSSAPGEGSGGGAQGGGDPYGYPGGLPGGSGGPLTPAEQVAILEGQLEQGAGEFDTIILESEAEQREAAREQANSQGASGGAQPGSGGGFGDAGDSPFGEGMAEAGDGTLGGGLGGASRGGSVPQNTAKYPPPADIPSGDDDDVVARQLREAAMREPDPAVREKLWDEYRKYKGIDQ